MAENNKKKSSAKKTVRKAPVRKTTGKTSKINTAIKLGAAAAAAVKTAKKNKKSGGNSFAAIFVCLFLVLAIGAGLYYFFVLKKDKPDKNIAFADADISVHFIELGNKYTGDCTLIKVGDTEMLIDCGSKTSSVQTVSEYLNNYVEDGIIEYVIITHAHEDHYAGFATAENDDSIFDLYECKTIITFAKATEKTMGYDIYGRYIRELNYEVANGATHYTADKCYNEEDGASRTYDLGKGYELEILYNKFYWDDTTNENNNSVCCMVHGDGKYFLFTGDLEKKGEEALAAQYKIDHPSFNVRVDLYKAGHHGSKTSSNEKFLEVFKPKICCVCCCAGSPEYTSNTANQFPTQDFIDRISLYTDKVYITTLCVDYANNEFQSFNGNIVVFANAEGIGVDCSANNTVLKETAWFKENRTCAKWT